MNDTNLTIPPTDEPDIIDPGYMNTGKATKGQIIRDTTDEYLESLDIDDLPTPEIIEVELINLMKKMIRRENSYRSAGDRISIPEKLSPNQIARIMLYCYHIVRVNCGGSSSDSSYDLLAIYNDEGTNEGIYTTDEYSFARIAKKFNYNISKREMNDVLEFLKIDAPRVTRTTNRDLIAVNNGIFDFETKTLLEFDPRYVFLAKSKVDYNPMAMNPVIHNDDDGTDWDVENWMYELSDDPDIVEVLWEIMSAIIRPNVRWNKSAWLFSESGNNGKGTLCELMRSLCGEGSYSAIPLSDFGKDFALEPLTRSTAIIVDENDVGIFIDKAANLKAVITNDVIPINRKFKTPIFYQFRGFMVQCLNELPRVRDRSDSFYRRQLFIPFEKCFTGHERKYIKDDYLHRKEVLEYVLYRVLNMNFYTLSEPESCRNILAEYKEYNDPVRQFFLEMEDQFVWDLLPFSWLYELYKQWFRRNTPSGSIQGKQSFINEIIKIANEGDKWCCHDKHKTISTTGRMDKPEYLIAQYDVVDWQNKQYTGQDIDKICSPRLKPVERGLLRVCPANKKVI